MYDNRKSQDELRECPFEWRDVDTGTALVLAPNTPLAIEVVVAADNSGKPIVQRTIEPGRAFNEHTGIDVDVAVVDVLLPGIDWSAVLGTDGCTDWFPSS